MPAYADSRWSVLFFALYLILAHWFLLNLVLGVVYKAHADNARANADAAAAHREPLRCAPPSGSSRMMRRASRRSSENNHYKA